MTPSPRVRGEGKGEGQYLRRELRRVDHFVRVGEQLAHRAARCLGFAQPDRLLDVLVQFLRVTQAVDLARRERASGREKPTWGG